MQPSIRVAPRRKKRAGLPRGRGDSIKASAIEAIASETPPKLQKKLRSSRVRLVQVRKTEQLACDSRGMQLCGVVVVVVVVGRGGRTSVAQDGASVGEHGMGLW